MMPHPLTVVVLIGLASASGVTSSISQALAADLPKSGSFDVHSGWKAIGETIQVAENHAIGSGSFWGVSYNDAGSGPLHVGAVLCPYSLEVINGTGTAQGTCAWSDADGSQLFTAWSGKIAANGELDGVNTISGGTGKFNAIQGTVPFHCKPLNNKNQWACTQHFDYRLP